MARGLTSDEATSVIVRGFLDVEIKGFPEDLRQEIKKITRERISSVLILSPFPLLTL
jgi:Fe-S cluster assembly scaffold protein SufB